MKKTVFIIFTFSIILGFSTFAFGKMTLKYGMVAPPDNPGVIASQAFADYVKERTNGEITIEIYPMAQLGSQRSMANQVQTGVLEMAGITTAVLANYVPQMQLFDLPFLWPSRGVAYSVLDDSEFFNIISDLFAKKNLVAVGYEHNDMRDFTNVKREVRKPEDLKRIKIRVMDSPVYLQTWKAFGANPVDMPFSEIYSALQQGVIDAQENPITMSHLMKFTEVCQYVTLMEYCLSEVITIMNLDVWNKLTPEQQQIFYDGKQKAIKQNREDTIRLRDKIISELEHNAGVKVTYLTEENREAFQQKVQPVYDKIEKDTGKIPNKKEYGRFGGMTYLKMVQEKIRQYD